MYNISSRELYRNSVSKNVDILSHIPPTEKEIWLRGNSLGNLNSIELAQAFQAIPDTVESIDLEYNNLGIRGGTGRRGEEVALPLTALHKNLKSLNLGLNALGSMSSKELIIAISSIPPVTTLGLGFNNFEEKTAEQLKQAFSKISDSVKTLDLSGNHFDRRSGDELGEIFSSLHVEKLILQANNLYEKSDAELEVAFSQLRESVTTIDLTDNVLTEAQLSVILRAAPHVQNIICGERTISRPGSTATAAVASEVSGDVTRRYKGAIRPSDDDVDTEHVSRPK